MTGSSPRVVALGGGHGLAATLTALRRVTSEVTAIVTVADDGGSSGRLRREYGVLPPGDLRMALAALCDEDLCGEDPCDENLRDGAGEPVGERGPSWARVLQHRFGGGELAGHAVGNLLIVALWELLGDPVAGLDWVGRMLRARGRVLPMAAVPLEIVATVEGLDPVRPTEMSVVRGQASVAVTPGRVRSIELLPADPPAVPEAVSAVLSADWVVFGPGSWFTSVLPHLLVPSLASALAATSARRLVALNLVPQPGETEGFSPHRHLEVLADHAPSLTFDVVLADRGAVSGAEDELAKAAALLHASLALSDVAAADGARHDPELLADAYQQVFTAGSDGPAAGSGRTSGSNGPAGRSDRIVGRSDRTGPGSDRPADRSDGPANRSDGPANDLTAPPGVGGNAPPRGDLGGLVPPGGGVTGGAVPPGKKEL